MIAGAANALNLYTWYVIKGSTLRAVLIIQISCVENWSESDYKIQRKISCRIHLFTAQTHILHSPMQSLQGVSLN